MEKKQKLVTVFLHDQMSPNGAYGDSESGPCFGVREHLEEYLGEGWEIAKLDSIGGAGGCLSGWVIVVLEKSAY